MFVELAIGDAYGAGFEYVDRAEWSVPNNTIMGYAKHPRHFLSNPAGRGVYTDDTQMTIALAELFIEQLEWTPINIANKFVDIFKRDWRDGYARGFQAFLESIKTGEEFLAKIKPDSKKSGGAMRAAPCGLFSSKEEVISKATIQCKLTHDTKEGIEAARAAALMVFYCRNNIGPKKELREYLVNTLMSGFWVKPHHGKVGSLGLDSTNAALTSLEKHNSLKKMLIDCVEWTGDVDTVATIALAAGSVCEEVSNDLPQILYRNMESGQYGLEYLKGLDRKIFGSTKEWVDLEITSEQQRKLDVLKKAGLA